jgi:hypothetical protein
MMRSKFSFLAKGDRSVELPVKRARDQGFPATHIGFKLKYGKRHNNNST